MTVHLPAASGRFFYCLFLYFCPVEEEINKAKEVIDAGGVILYPTDTIWGLGCDPKNDDAIQKIIDIKKRSEAKHFIILVNSEQLLSRYVKEIPSVCFDLIDFASKPLTIIYPKGQYVSDKILGEDGSIGVRIVNTPFCKKLMERLKSGIVSTSANISGEPHPKSFEEISKEIKNNVDYIVNLPQKNQSDQASQIIKIGLNGEVKIIRK